jgi:phospholipase A2
MLSQECICWVLSEGMLMNFGHHFLYKHARLLFLTFSITLLNLSANHDQNHEHTVKKSDTLQKSSIGMTVSVRQGIDLCNDEKAIVKLRLHRAQEKLESELNQSIHENEVPTIGIVGSGGGYRSMISMLGFLIGLNKYNFLDASTYMASVSGSGWCMGSWLAQPYSLSELKEFLRNQVTTDLALQDFGFLALQDFSWTDIASQLYNKINHGQPINQSDLWGCILSEVLLKGLAGGGHQVLFSSLKSKIQTGMYPLPLFTAVLDETTPYEWFEFTPFEIGSEKSACWIPSYAFGKKFDRGLSSDTGPEQTLGYILGLSSSAFAANFKDLVSLLFDNINLLLSKKCVNFQGLFSDVGETQVPPPTVFNFMKNIAGTLHANKEYLSFFDPGVDINLGFAPLLRRNVNVYLVCDASDTAVSNQKNTLRQAQRYANDNNFKFPRIDYNTVGTDKVSLFYDEEDPEVPVIIYFPNKVQFSTFKFCYTNDEFNQLYRSSKDAVESSYDTICRGITIAINNLKKINQQTE